MEFYVTRILTPKKGLVWRKWGRLWPGLRGGGGISVPQQHKRTLLDTYCGSPSSLAIYGVYKFVRTGYVADNCKGKSGCPRVAGSTESIPATYEAYVRSPGQYTRLLPAEWHILQSTVRRILNNRLGIRPIMCKLFMTWRPQTKNTLNVATFSWKWRTWIMKFINISYSVMRQLSILVVTWIDKTVSLGYWTPTHYSWTRKWQPNCYKSHRPVFHKNGTGQRFLDT
jgi:hypothetical protein